MDMMTHALELASAAAQAGEVPVGAVITDSYGAIVATAQNRMRRDNNALAHAELLVINDALQVTGQSRLKDCDLWVTLEPCAMCAGAIAHVRLRLFILPLMIKKAGL